MSAEQIAAAQKAFGAPAQAADVKREMLEAIKRGSPEPLPGAASGHDDCLAFIKRVGAM